jgi:hypothetical protein
MRYTSPTRERIMLPSGGMAPATAARSAVGRISDHSEYNKCDQIKNFLYEPKLRNDLFRRRRRGAGRKNLVGSPLLEIIKNMSVVVEPVLLCVHLGGSARVPLVEDVFHARTRCNGTEKYIGVECRVRTNSMGVPEFNPFLLE